MATEFVCRDCGAMFTLPPTVLARYPGWTPRECPACRGEGKADRAPNLTPSEVLDRFQSGPQRGVFTDGCCEPNPGPGGWGAVKVINGQLVEQRHGHERWSTNNRMELRALIEGYKMISAHEDLPVFTDSELCVNTITKWAANWQRQGWTRGRKRAEVKNLDVVKELYDLAKSRPGAKLKWIRGHEGSRWNEYADSLSRAYQIEVG